MVLGNNSGAGGIVDELTGSEVTALLDAAAEGTSGVLELATQAETDAGTDDARAVTPLKLKVRLDNLDLKAPVDTTTFGVVGKKYNL